MLRDRRACVQEKDWTIDSGQNYTEREEVVGETSEGAGMSDEDTLLAGLEECRWQHLRLLADEAEERGDVVMALGWRWLAEHRKWPGGLVYQVGASATTRWCWYDPDGRRNDCEDHLPIRFGPNDYGTLRAAFLAGARAMGEWLLKKRRREEAKAARKATGSA
jgi:hypothetical protein